MHRYRYRHIDIHQCKCRSSVDQMIRRIRILIIQSFWGLLLILLLLFQNWRVIFLLMCSRKSLNSLNMMCQGVYFLILILLEKSLSFLDLWFGVDFFSFLKIQPFFLQIFFLLFSLFFWNSKSLLKFSIC